MKNTLRTPYFLTLFASLGLVLAPVGCGSKGDDTAEEETGDGDGDPGDGDGDPGDGDGDPGDGDGTPGDGDGSPGDGDGSPGECVPGAATGDNGAVCTSDTECASCNCYLVPFLGGQCGECNSDSDCADITGGGCTPPNPFESDGSTCNMGEAGGGCESSAVCADDLTCGTVLDLLGVIKISTCGECSTSDDCEDDLLCAPVVVVEEFNGQNTCVEPNSLPQHSFCNIGAAGDAVCESGICSTVDIMGIAQVGACGECNINADCDGGACMPGGFDIGSGTLTGSVCG